MQDHNTLQALVLVMAVSLFTVYALRHLKIPIVVGFLLSGVIIGPGMLGLIHDQEQIEGVAEIGVIFLLFTIGLRLSLRELSRMRAMIFGAGALQVGLTIGCAAGLGAFLRLEFKQSLFFGYLLAMSSTAIVLKILEERGETDSPHGRLCVAVAIFQDLAAVPMMLSLPLLSNNGEATLSMAGFTLIKSLVMVTVIIVAARFFFPWFLERMVRTRSHEVFTLTTVLVALGTAFLAGWAGVSLALGAFLAGVVISESEYSQQILAETSPFSDAFGSLFFISVGMLVDPLIWIHSPILSLVLAVGVFLFKALLMGAVGMAFGFGPRVSTLSAVGLAQIGEFSFILLIAGAGYGLFDDSFYKQFLSVSVLTMTLTPFAMMYAPRLAGNTQYTDWVERRLLGVRRDAPMEAPQPEDERLEGHVIIVGYGVNGKNVSRVLQHLQVPSVILELNSETVRSVSQKGERIRYGDATREAVLDHVAVRNARVLVVAIADPASCRGVVAVARKKNPQLIIIVRTRYIAEVDDLYRLGANEVVPEEFETSLELVGKVMVAYEAPERAIRREKDAIRQERYGLLLGKESTAVPKTPLSDLLSSVDLDEVILSSESPAINSSLRSLNLRGRTGASVLAIGREGRIISNPDPDFELQAEDVVILFGQAAEIDAARDLLASETKSEV